MIFNQSEKRHSLLWEPSVIDEECQIQQSISCPSHLWPPWIGFLQVIACAAYQTIPHPTLRTSMRMEQYSTVSTHSMPGAPAPGMALMPPGPTSLGISSALGKGLTLMSALLWHRPDLQNCYGTGQTWPLQAMANLNIVSIIVAQVGPDRLNIGHAGNI